MKEIQHKFKQLYKGEQSELFDEVNYLTDVVNLRQNVLDLAKKYNLLKKNKEMNSNLFKEEDSFPTGNERIAKNGGFVLSEFDAFTGIPKSIITPFGKVSILNNDFYSELQIKGPRDIKGFFQKRKWQSNIKKFKQEMEKKFGLLEMEGKENVNKNKKAISKLPWRLVEVPNETYFVEESQQSLVKDESIYLRKVFDVVNTGLVMNGHDERVMPGTDNEYSLYGQTYKISDIAKKNPKKIFTQAMDNLREMRNPLNASLYGMSSVQMESQNNLESHIEQEETKQVKNVDLGREM